MNDYATELAKRITSDHVVNVYNVLLVKPRSFLGKLGCLAMGFFIAKQPVVYLILKCSNLIGQFLGTHKHKFLIYD